MIGRSITAVFGTISVLIVYLIAARIFNKKIGLISAFFFAISPLHVAHSKLIRTDITATMFILLSFYFIVVLFESKKIKHLVLAGFFAGVAIATKYTSGIIILSIILACILVNKRNPYENRKYFAKTVTLITISFISIFIGFFAFSPYTVLDHQNAMRSIEFENRDTHLGAERLPHIWNYIWYLQNPLNKGTGGLLIEIFAGIGFVYLLLSKSKLNYILLSFFVLYFIAIGSMKLRWDRWMIPNIPFTVIMAGLGAYLFSRFLLKLLIRNYPSLNVKKLKYPNMILIILVLILAIQPISAVLKYDYILSQKDTRTIGKEWIEENMPGQSYIAIEDSCPPLNEFSEIYYRLLFQKWARLADRPFSYYEKNSVDYICITSSYKDRFFNEPDKYKSQIKFYEELEEKATLIKLIENKWNPGPVIEIYQLKK